MVDEALAKIDEVLHQASINYPEFQPSKFDISSESVGNTPQLQDSFIIEALNLRALIQFNMDDTKGAQTTISMLPFRNEQQLDAVTLHNLAILNSEHELEDSLGKLDYLTSLIPGMPDETIWNLIVLYGKSNNWTRAQDVIAQHSVMLQETTSPVRNS